MFDRERRILEQAKNRVSEIRGDLMSIVPGLADPTLTVVGNVVTSLETQERRLRKAALQLAEAEVQDRQAKLAVELNVLRTEIQTL